MADETRPLQHGKDEILHAALIMIYWFHGSKRWGVDLRIFDAASGNIVGLD